MLNKEPMEADSIAGSATARALRLWETQRMPFPRYLAMCVRVQIWDYWRKKAKRKEEQQTDVWWEREVYDVDELQEGLDQADLKLLTEYYIQKWPLDVVARRNDTTVYQIRKMLKAATARLLALYPNVASTAAQPLTAENISLRSVKRLHSRAIKSQVHHASAYARI